MFYLKFSVQAAEEILYFISNSQAAEEMRSVDESIGSGKLYFTGTGYTVNLIPHAIVLGLLALGESPPPPVLLLLLLPLLLLLLISNDVISLSESRGGKTIALATGANSGTERKTFHSPFPIAPLVNNVNNVVVSLFDISTLLLGECRQPLSENWVEHRSELKGSPALIGICFELVLLERYIHSFTCCN